MGRLRPLVLDGGRCNLFESFRARLRARVREMRIAAAKSGLVQTVLLGFVLSPVLCVATQAQDTAKPGDSAAKQAAQPAPAQKPAAAPMTAEEKRRADLQADTEKLYKLTQELKAEVAKSNKNTLSVSVVMKAQEIERLAKSIKDRSKAQ